MSQAQYPEDARRRGEALNRAGLHRQAIAVMRPAAEAVPGDPWLRCELAEALLQSGRGRQALEHALAAYQINPTSPRVLQMVAECQLESNHLDDAIAATDRLIELSPGFAAGYDLRGRIAMRLKNFRAAEGYFREALRIEPNNWALNNNLGVTLRHQKRDKEAIEVLERAVRLNPSNGAVRRNLYGATSTYVRAGTLIAAIIFIRVALNAATGYGLPSWVAGAAFFASVIAAAAGAWLWARHRRRALSGFVNQNYDREYWRAQALFVVRYLFRLVPVLAIVIGVLWFGTTEPFGFLPWLVIGGAFVVVWWFAWQPAWRRVVAIFSRL